MTEKQNFALQSVLSLLPDDCRESYAEVARHAISLGYMPVLKGARKDYADFTNAKLKRTILKINTNPDFRWIAMKFFALPAYAGVFEDAIRERLAYWRKLGYETRCFGCGKCDGTQGYTVSLPGGEQGFLCGFGVIPLPAFRAENIDEVKDAMTLQHEYFVRQAKA